MTIAVLALQGAFIEHEQMLQNLFADQKPVGVQWYELQAFEAFVRVL